MGFTEAATRAADIALEIERARVLGTTMPTAEEITDVLNGVGEESCDECANVHGALSALLDVTSYDEIRGVLRTVYGKAGFMDERADRYAQAVIAAIKAAK